MSLRGAGCVLVDKSDEETVETRVEQTSAASLAWVLDTCAEAVVELTDAEDFADACIAAGPAHHGRLMTGAATRLLLRANRSLVITQGRGWAEREEEFELTLAEHLGAVREWIAFEEDGRGTRAEQWVQEHVARLEEKKGWEWTKPEEKEEYDARIQRVRETGFITEPADPRRAAVLARLEATVYCHGAINVPADGDRDPYFDYSQTNSKETAVVLSLSDGLGGRRTLWVCSHSEGNICEPGCWCAGHEMYSVHALIEPTEEELAAAADVTVWTKSEDEKGTRYDTAKKGVHHRRKKPTVGWLRVKDEGGTPYWYNYATKQSTWDDPATGSGWVRVLTFDYANGEAGGMGDSGLHTATPSQAARIAARLGIDASDFGAAVRLVVLAANVKGQGCMQWHVVEKAHAKEPMKKQSGYCYHSDQQKEAARAAVEAEAPELATFARDMAVMKKLGEMWGALDAAAQQKYSEDAPIVEAWDKHHYDGYDSETDHKHNYDRPMYKWSEGMASLQEGEWGHKPGEDGEPRRTGHWPDNARSGDFRVRRVCGAGAVNTFPRVGDSDHKPPKYARSMMQSAGESPRGVLKRILSKLSKIATPAALESLPRLVATLGGSAYLHDIVASINRKYYKRKLRQHEAQAGKGVAPDPEEEQYWRYEIPHTIS